MSLFLSRFRGLLEESPKTQKEICEDLGIRSQKLSNWKTGYSEPNFDDLVMLASYFDVTADYLLGAEDDFGNITIKKEKSPADNLSAEEKELLENFRQLNLKNKMHVSTYARIRLEEQDEFSDKRKA